MRASILTLMLLATHASAEPDKSGPGRFPESGSEEAWAKLPRENPQLPPWAKMLVGPLPRTTARMLELDYFHREKNPLGSALSSQLRWTAADALGSAYGKATAVADLRRGGAKEAALSKLAVKDIANADVKLAAAFARKLTLEGHAITDEEFAEVLKAYGPEKTTAIVHTVAYANFHNRIALGIGATGDPVPPIDAKFAPETLAKVPTPTRPPWDDLKSVKSDGLSVRVDWGQANAEALNGSLDQQKARKLRIPLPDRELIDALPPKEQESARRILWNTVSAGYQPDFTRVWFAALSCFYDEAKVDRVFTNSVFWVVTRTNDCFY